MEEFSLFNLEENLKSKIYYVLIQSYNLIQEQLNSLKNELLNSETKPLKKEKRKKKYNSFKRGRIKRTNQKNKIITIHSKMSFDNILRKIKVMYHNFIIKFVNDYIKFIYDGFQRFRLRKISGKITQNVTKKHNKILSNVSLKEFLSNKISSKYKQDKDKNKKIVNKLCILKTQIKELFEMSYINFYKKIFLCSNRNFLEEKFGLSENTLTFKDNLELMSENENINYIKEVERIGKKKIIEFLGIEQNNKNTYFGKGIESELKDIDSTISSNGHFNFGSKKKINLFEVKKSDN